MRPDHLSNVIDTLCYLLQYSPDARLRARCAKFLGELGSEEAIPLLCNIARQDSDVQVCLAAVEAMASIAKSQLPQTMTEPSKNQPTFHIQQVGNINTGDVDIKGDQIGIQNNYSNDLEIQATITEIKTTLTKLQARYSEIQTEEQALKIIDVEFTEIKRDQNSKLTNLRKYLLDPQRRGQAIRATIVEISKEWADQNLFLKALITYSDKLTESD